MEYNIFDFIGNVGVALIIGAYLLLQLEKINSNNILYSVANTIGALFVIISLSKNFNLSAFIIESFWLLISLVGIYKGIKTAGA